MLILPAIDLRDGCCVRLRQGDYAQETVFGDDPAAMARRWVAQGAQFLHLVDLDGAKRGQPSNGQAIRAILSAVDVPCQVGGGIRSEEHIDEVLSWGVARVILGTRALEDPAWLMAMANKHPQKIVLGLDARKGRVATNGWLRTSDSSALEVARECSAWPLAAIVYTDIDRDGMMEGPNVDATVELASSVSVPVIASGGVRSSEDVLRLARLGVAGCIIGRALYEGRVDLAALIVSLQEEPADCSAKPRRSQ